MASRLFTPLSIKNITLKNRIVVSPMCQYSSVDGFANDWHLVHLGSRAVGGAALLIAEATAVSPEGRISPEDLGIWKDEHIAKLKQITDFISAQGAVPGIQLAHAGRKASTYPAWKGRGQVPASEGGWQTLSASAIPFHGNELAPLPLDLAGIEKVISDFTDAAKRALQAGFKVVEIHAAHGYLIHQFLSPLSNVRTDDYGGSFENRVRLLIQVIDAIQKEWPADLPLFVRISATDWAEHGWDEDQSVELVNLLKTKGVDLIDVSSGGLVAHQKITIGPSYQVPFSAKIKKETGSLTGTVGLITEAKQSEEILQNGEADLIIMAREMLRDPYFPLHAAHELGEDIAWPIQYDRAKPTK
ncbi:NADH:flavin oxidoreductase/NADH oxidase [Dyadobacter fanqingshengii]|uniref:NADH:flavin oxidoreductase/NADH oxidase n=1 Tax=Dyadobacter fanqingshengii TaxID=2906443 RepID=A0A9X1P8V7_9BACT|nr:NADH:flavin oxidoreductase/NADH oxidase [Dyadobacter fanqingshengii]MCF0040180.1 NADH:flavin oxidoreductase/NADH oxidase [Dyadobacter fanqingshengii]USJ38069.1 NADH:flavin oxidoreductase/NADH oxidase [Dyadobacter fanqingshengii]